MRSLTYAIALVFVASGAHGQPFVASSTELRDMVGAIGSSGRVLELQVPQQAQNSAEVLAILLDRRRTAGSERAIDPALADELRGSLSQVFRHSAPVPPHLFQVESALRFEEPGGQALMLICKSCQQPIAMIASERTGSVELSPYFRIGSIQRLLERASTQFRVAPSERPVMPLPRN